MSYKTSVKIEKRKSERRGDIIDAAAALFETKGYALTTIKDIAEAANISIGTFYLHFKNKETLLEILYDRFISSLENVSNYSLENSGNIVRGFCRSKTSELWLFQNCRGLARAMIIEAVGFSSDFAEKRNAIFSKSYNRIFKYFVDMKSSGALSEADPWVATLLCSGTLYGIIDEWLQSDEKTNLINYALPIIVFNLNAFKISYDESELKFYINEMLDEIHNNYQNLVSFNLNVEDEINQLKVV